LKYELFGSGSVLGPGVQDISFAVGNGPPLGTLDGILLTSHCVLYQIDDPSAERTLWLTADRGTTWKALGSTTTEITTHNIDPTSHAILFPTPSLLRHTHGTSQSSLNTNIVCYGRTTYSFGSNITYVPNVILGDSWSINTAGIYTVSWNVNLSATGVVLLKTAIVLNNSIADADQDYLTFQECAKNSPSCGFWCGKLEVTKVWLATSKLPSGANLNQFTITHMP